MSARQQPTRYDYMEDVKANVLQKFPLLGVTMSKLDTKPTEGALAQVIDTAATNGKTVYFNPEFFQSLNEDQRAFIYAHEVMHVAFNHIMRSKGKQPKLWNTATDAVINQILKKEGYEIVGEGVDMPEALNHSAEEIYDKLLEKQNQNSQDNNSQQQASDNNQESQDSQGDDNGQSQSDDKQSKDQQSEKSSQNDKSAADKNQEQNGEKKPAGNADSNNQKQQQNNENQPQDAQGRGGKEADEQNQQQEQDGEANSENTSSAEQQQNKQRSATAQNKQLQTPPQNIEADLTDEESSLQHGHGLWEQAIEEAEKEAAKREENAAKQSLFERIKGIFKPENQQKNDEQQKSDAEEQNLEGNFLAQNRRLRHKKQQEVKQKISEHKKEVLDAIGKIGTDMPQQRNLGESQQVADWKKILKQNMLDPEDKWSYRRSGADNDYMARSEELEDEVKAKTEVMIDVSGSVDEELVKEFLRQLKPLLKRSDIMVGCFDDEFYPFKEIKNKKDIDNFRIPGGGGTDLDLAVRSFSDDKDTNKIIFTDGEGEMPTPDLKNVKNLFWVVYQNETPSWYYEDRSYQGDWFKPVCGKVIYVKRKEIAQDYVRRQTKYIGR